MSEAEKKEAAIRQYFAQVDPPKVAHADIRKKLEPLTVAEIEEEMIRRLNAPGPIRKIRDEIKNYDRTKTLDQLDGTADSE